MQTGTSPSDILYALMAVVLGPLVTYVLYWLLNALVNLFPRKISRALRPYVFIGPVLALVIGLLLIPTVQAVMGSFQTADPTAKDPMHQKWVGWQNYSKLFSDPNFFLTVRNNFEWIAIVPIVTVILGIMIATLTDRMGPVRERVAKSIIFMPMAISFVAASSIWRLTYSWNPPPQHQIGMLNAIIDFFGGKPLAWVQVENFGINNILLMVVVIWSNAGFAMTLLSAAIKAVPDETIEAASIDGANAAQSFFRIVLPQIRVTAVSVFITVLISTMKIFDVVWGMTGGDFHTNVLGVDFFRQYFVYNNPGKASAIVVLLMIAIVPVMIYQIYTYRKQEDLR